MHFILSSFCEIVDRFACGGPGGGGNGWHAPRQVQNCKAFCHGFVVTRVLVTAREWKLEMKLHCRAGNTNGKDLKIDGEDLEKKKEHK